MVTALALMGDLPIHRNLNTSFVNLSGMVQHLRRLGFIGRIQLELSSYEAEIEFCEDGSVRGHEQDLIAGRLSVGDDALQRIMIRSRESGGLIHVFKGTERAHRSEPVFVDRTIALEARKMAAGALDEKPTIRIEEKEKTMAATSVAESPIPKPSIQLEPETTENWTELLALISELMQTVDTSLAKGNISFVDLFRNASGFVSLDHPFLDPDSDVFAYEDGYISVRRRLAGREIIAGVTAAIARIMRRLREDPYFGNVYHQTMHRIRVLANRRKLQFDSFGIGLELQKITGI